MHKYNSPGRKASPLKGYRVHKRHISSYLEIKPMGLGSLWSRAKWRNCWLLSSTHVDLGAHLGEKNEPSFKKKKNYTRILARPTRFMRSVSRNSVTLTEKLK